MATTKVTTGGITDATIATADIADDAVTNAKIAAGAVGGTQLGNNAVTAAKIGANEVTSAAIAAGAVGTAKLSDQCVTLDKLPHGTSSNDGKFLRANNGADPTFETVSSVGGATGVDFNDNVKARFGAGHDLEIYHNGSTSYVRDTGTGNLRFPTSKAEFRNNGDTQTLASFTDGGACELYHNDTKKFETTSTGVTVQSSGSNHGITVKHSNGNMVARMVNKGSGDEGYITLYDAGEVPTIKMDAEHGRITASSIRLGTDSADNELDDYEEGTWTPANANFSTYNNVTWDATYTKIGRTVHVNAIQTGGETNWGNGQSISGLPFQVEKTGAGSWTNNAPSDAGSVLVWDNEYLYFAPARASVSSSHKLRITATYQTNQ